MNELFNILESFLESDNGRLMYLVFAIFGSGILLLTGALQIFGVGGVASATGVDLDMDGDIDIPHDTGLFDFKLLSFRSILAFIAMFGWGGFVWGENGWWGFLAALACGTVTMLITAFAISIMLKMQQDGTRKNDDFIGMDGIVYLGIPSNRDGAGKIVVTVSDSTCELKAIADTEIKTGESVKIVSRLAGNVFLVEKLS